MSMQFIDNSVGAYFWDHPVVLNFPVILEVVVSDGLSIGWELFRCWR